jgi:hypothetical protein
VYWWYLVRKECGNIYLDIDVTIGSGVSGIRDGTATTGGDVGGDEGGSDSVPGDSDASNLSTVGGSVAGGDREEDGDIVEMLGGV